MRYLHLILLITLLCSVQIFGQNRGTLRGFVTDSTNGEAVIYANVIIKNTTHGSPTNTQGYYFIPSIPAGEHTAIISYLGYQRKEISVIIQPNKITQLDVKLSPQSIELKELSIIGEKSVRENETDLGLEKITIKDIELVPAGVEADIFRVLQATPGVSTTGDVTSKYYVRGGGGDQNVVLLNGATIYNPFHALGIFSVVDPEMISVVEFYKGGFAPDYGGRLSSILNIVTKDGNKNEFQGTAQASLISGKVAIEGPIPYGSFLVTGRKSYYSDILKKYLNESDAPFDFYDFSFKANFSNPNIDRNGKFTVHGFMSSDIVDNDDPFIEDYSVKNNIFGIGWNKVWSSPLFSEMFISYSGFRAEVMPNLSKAKPRLNEVTDITGDWNFTYIYDNKDEFHFGLQNKIISTNLTQQNLFGNTIEYKQEGWDMNIFASYKFYRWEKLGLELGVRGKLIGLSEKRPFLLEPRASVTYRPVGDIALKFAVGRYSQEMVTISNEEELISIFEPWIIVPDYVAALQSTHYIFGFTAYLSDQLTFEFETYYKDLINLLEENDQKFTADFNDYINVDGEAYGFEAMIQYQSSWFFSKGSYALSWAYKIRNGERFFPRYDKRHNINLLAGIDFGSGWESSVTWNFSSGMPFTPIAGFYDRLDIIERGGYYDFSNFTGATFWGEKNSRRLPVYHRLDLSIKKKFRLGFADITLGASVLNIYDRNNIYYFDRRTAKRVNMLPFLPSVSIKAEF